MSRGRGHIENVHHRARFHDHLEMAQRPAGCAGKGLRGAKKSRAEIDISHQRARAVNERQRELSVRVAQLVLQAQRFGEAECVGADSAGNADDLDAVADSAEIDDFERRGPGDAASDGQRVSRRRREVGGDSKDSAASKVVRNADAGCGTACQVQRPRDRERRHAEASANLEQGSTLDAHSLKSDESSELGAPAGLDGQRIGPRSGVVQHARSGDGSEDDERVVAAAERKAPGRLHHGSAANREGGVACVVDEHGGRATDRASAFERDVHVSGTGSLENRDGVQRTRPARRDFAAQADGHVAVAVAAHGDGALPSGNRPYRQRNVAVGRHVDQDSGPQSASDRTANIDRDASASACVNAVQAAGDRPGRLDGDGARTAADSLDPD